MVSLASSCVIIELDTTAPQVAIYAPRYTTADVVNEIVIEANEALSDYQDVYAIDSVGVRHDYTFQRVDGNHFVGLIRFNDFPFGIATIYARMKDYVDNYSDVVSASIEVKETSPSLIVRIGIKQRAVVSGCLTRKMNVSNNVRNIRIKTVGKDDAQ